MELKTILLLTYITSFFDNIYDHDAALIANWNSVVDDNDQLQGLLTDGDIRRGLRKGVDFLARPVTELMTKTPKTITEEKLAAQALHIMESNIPKPITVLPVVDGEMHVIGLLHMTDLVRQGVV